MYFKYGEGKESSVRFFCQEPVADEEFALIETDRSGMKDALNELTKWWPNALLICDSSTISCFCGIIDSGKDLSETVNSVYKSYREYLDDKEDDTSDTSDTSDYSGGEKQ